MLLKILLVIKMLSSLFVHASQVFNYVVRLRAQLFPVEIHGVEFLR